MSSDSDASATESKALKRQAAKRKKTKCGSDSEIEGYNNESEVKIPRINPISVIRNKALRNKAFQKVQLERKKTQKKERKKRQKEGGERSTGHTLESLREKDETTVEHLEDSENEELRLEMQMDELSNYYSKEIEPRVLITFSDHPHPGTRMFGRELTRIIPNCLTLMRNRSSVKKICQSAIRENFTDVLIINENQKKVNGLLHIHLPHGPTAHFRVSNVKLTSEMKKNYREISKHRPEVILTNFSTRLGLSIGRLLGSLFHFDPEFRGRRAVTFHNQRDYIFFRHHRYEFTKDGKRAKLHELGPRFTLKLRSLQQGLFDSKTGDYEWIISNKRHMMESRRRFFL
ncbi:probable ribosome production factor 1 [Phlebotomus argentipes]|uniref:probable ribosome production factor 1 n=1 Tax=Phlebotomus argentipes TaxID=94469 RepID=UPI0028935B9D|nr:probable ribosome production factor 1 [Phlebotomus argentipes]